jgi:hypothetical protein
MTTYTQADADAAKAKLAQDTQTLAADQQAVIAAQAGVTSAAQAVSDAEAALAVAQQNLAGAQGNLATAEAALSSANDAVVAVKADIAAQQAIIDAFNAQPPVVVIPPSTGNYVMPDLPKPPVGPFAAYGGSSSLPLSLVLAKKLFKSHYIDLDEADKALLMDLLQVTDAQCSDLGSLFYMVSGGHLKTALLERVACANVRAGRPFLRFCGVINSITVNDLDLTYVGTNTQIGNIATAVSVGNKATGEAIGSVKASRIRVQNIYDNLPSDLYWNGDGFTTERTLGSLDLSHVTVINAPDGAVDSKARTNKISYVYAERCRQALKLWDDTVADHIVSINPVLQGGIGGKCHLRLMGGTRVRKYEMTNVWADGDAPLIRIENGPIEFHGTGKYIGGSSPLVSKTNGGSLVAGSTWNGQAIK